MKTYLFDTIERFKRFSQSLDVKTILCSKAWYVLNEDGDTENLIFQEDGTVLVSINGSLKKYTWLYIPQNQSLSIMHTDTDGTMLKPAYLDDKVLAFQKIGTKECMFLIDDALGDKDKMLTLDSVKKHLIETEQRAIEEQKKLMLLKLVAERNKQLELEEAERKKIAEKRIKQEKIEKLHQEINEKQLLLSNDEQEIRRFYDTTYGYWAAFFSVVHDSLEERRDFMYGVGCIAAFVILFISVSMAAFAGLQINTLTILAIIIASVDGLLFAIGSIFLKDDNYFYLSYKSTYGKCWAENRDKPLKKYNKKIYLEIKPLIFKYRALQTSVADLTAQIEKLQAELNELEK